MKENRTKTIKIRLTEDEKERVVKRSKEEGITLSSFMRKSVLCEKFVSKTDVQTVFELKKIGNNLNQLAKHINSLPIDKIILNSLESIDKYIKELRQITDKLV